MPNEEPLPSGLTPAQQRRFIILTFMQYAYAMCTFFFFLMAVAFLLSGDEDTSEGYFLKGGLALMGSIFIGLWRLAMLPSDESSG